MLWGMLKAQHKHRLVFIRVDNINCMRFWTQVALSIIRNRYIGRVTENTNRPTRAKFARLAYSCAQTIH